MPLPRQFVDANPTYPLWPLWAAINAAEEENPPFGLFLRLAAATGARRGELCSLTWATYPRPPLSNRDIDLLRTGRKLSRQGHQESLQASREPRPGHGAVAPNTTSDRTRNHLRRGADANSFVFSNDADGRPPGGPTTSPERGLDCDERWTRSRATTRPSTLSSDDAASERDSCEGRQQAHRTPRRGDDFERLCTRARVNRPKVCRRNRGSAECFGVAEEARRPSIRMNSSFRFRPGVELAPGFSSHVVSSRLANRVSRPISTRVRASDPPDNKRYSVERPIPRHLAAWLTVSSSGIPSRSTAWPTR